MKKHTFRANTIFEIDLFLDSRGTVRAFDLFLAENGEF
jgi:hypothetical protein